MKHPHTLLYTLSIALASASVLADQADAKSSDEKALAGFPPLPAPRPEYTSEWEEAKDLGIAAPLTQEEVAKLSPEELEEMRTGMKRLRLMQLIMEKANNYKGLDSAQLEELIALAKLIPLPASILPNLQYELEKKGSISSHARYFLRRSMDETLHTLRIDTKLMGVFFSRNILTDKQLKEMFADEGVQLSSLFNYFKPQIDSEGKPINSSPEELRIRAQRVMEGLASIVALYEGIRDKGSADEAWKPLHDLLPVYNELILIFQKADPALAQYFMDTPDDGNAVVSYAEKLHELREELRNLKFYGSHKMQFIDQLYF